MDPLLLKRLLDLIGEQRPGFPGPGLVAQLAEKNPRKIGSFSIGAFLVTEAEASLQKELHEALSPTSPLTLEEKVVLIRHLAGKNARDLKFSTLKARLTKRENVIAKVIRQNPKASGRGYCDLLDKADLRPPKAWIIEGCPTSYPEAYEKAKWKKRIWDEKSRVVEKLR